MDLSYREAPIRKPRPTGLSLGASGHSNTTMGQFIMIECMYKGVALRGESARRQTRRRRLDLSAVRGVVVLVVVVVASDNHRRRTRGRGLGSGGQQAPGAEIDDVGRERHATAHGGIQSKVVHSVGVRVSGLVAQPASLRSHVLGHHRSSSTRYFREVHVRQRLR